MRASRERLHRRAGEHPRRPGSVRRVSPTERWPAGVYTEGEEPDYRFSLANERTFLAWLRTSLALIAAGVAIDVLDLGIGARLTQALSILLLVTGMLTPAFAWLRWAASERAMRRSEPLPPVGALAVLLAGLLLLVAVALALVVGAR